MNEDWLLLDNLFQTGTPKSNKMLGISIAIVRTGPIPWLGLHFWDWVNVVETF